MRCGETDAGLLQMYQRYAAEPSTSHAIEFGIALSWLGKYSEASDHFLSFNTRYPHHASVTYALAGATKWCLEQPDDAIRVWRDGLDCDYSAAGLNVEVPLLLVFAGGMCADKNLTDEMETLLSKRLRISPAKKWPGALADFAIGRIDEDSLRASCINDHPDETSIRNLSADFYIGVIEFNAGDRVAFTKAMQKVAAASWTDFDLDRDAFLSRIWLPEFYLARHYAR